MRTVLAFLLGLLLAVSPRAQDPPRPAPQDPAAITTVALQARLDALTADATTPAEQKAPVAELLKKALEHAGATEARQKAGQRFEAARLSAADRLQQRRAELAALDQKRPGPPNPGLSLAELEAGLTAAQAAATAAQKQAAEVEAERARRAERRTALPQQLAEWKGKLDALPTATPEPADADPALATARRLSLLAERARDQAELDALDAESKSYDAEVELMRADADLAARRLAATKADSEAWLAAVQPVRAEAAAQAQLLARMEAARASPPVKNLADGNSALAAEAATLAQQRAEAEREKSQRDRALDDLQKEFDEVKKRVDLVRGGDALATLLRQKRTKLAATGREHQERIKNRTDRIADAQLKSIDYDELRRRLIADPERWLAEQLTLEPQQLDAPANAELLAAARPLRDARRDLLQQLADGYTSLLTTELDVDTSERQLTERIRAYRAFVTEAVLGLRSSRPLWRLDWRHAAQHLRWFLDVEAWSTVATATWHGIVLETWPLLLALLLLAVALGHRRLVTRLAGHGERAARGTNVDYSPTARSAIDTLLLALPIPLLLLLWSRQRAAPREATEFAKAVAAGAGETAWALLLVLVLRHVVRARGLAEAHFQWQTTPVAHLRRAAPLLLLSVLPFSFVLGMLELAPDDAGLGAFGGPLLLGQLGILLLVFSRLLHPRRGIIGGGIKSADALYRFRVVWYLLAIAIPLVLLAMVALGYEFTVLQLTRRFYLTVGVVVAGGIVHELILRGLLLARRRLQMRHAQARLEAARSGESAVTEAVDATAPDPQLLARQTQTLLTTAVTVLVLVVTFQVWVDVLPALGILRRFTVWGQAGSEGATTLADLTFGLFVLLASLLAARNLPALLELLVLQRFRMQAGERHAITTLTRYVLVGVGLAWTCRSFGIGWSNVQWLLAAMSVGLGFGLQEIFANFVSGLILLFERPMRVGDVVTVGTTTGRVTRIRIRATTIQDWDKKVLVVPNREFVTGQFTNWTLGDPVVRWVLPVGVAYGSDTERALRLLEQVARQSRFVVATPAPEAVFVGFGDSNLSLELRVFVDMNSLEYRWMTELYQGIDQAFREAGLEIAFPQRDVNLKLPGPLQAWLAQATDRARPR
ncbi:MAG: mechanosensitive ion channel [Planctomycetes bacterium]|nr:mechanosensitive ion channel [Planctomycetota bacterium]